MFHGQADSPSCCSSSRPALFDVERPFATAVAWSITTAIVIYLLLTGRWVMAYFMASNCRIRLTDTYRWSQLHGIRHLWPAFKTERSP